MLLGICALLVMFLTCTSCDFLDDTPDVKSVPYRIITQYPLICPVEFSQSTHQAIAVYNNYLIRTWIGGGIALYDLNNECELLLSLYLPLEDNILRHCHCANVSFGYEFYNDESDLPVIYVSETTGMKRCFVFDLRLNGVCTLVQEIQYIGLFGSGIDYRDYITDVENGDLYIVGYDDYGSSDNYLIIKKAKLLGIADGNISYSPLDISQTFFDFHTKVLQGAFVRNGYLFYADQSCRINVMDLASGTKQFCINLSSLTNELEGVSFFNRSILVDLGNQLVFVDLMAQIPIL